MIPRWLKCPRKPTFRINQSQVSSIDTVTDQQVIGLMSLAFHEFGIIVEPGGAKIIGRVVLSAIKQKAVNPDENIVAVLSGGNISKERHRNLIN